MTYTLITQHAGDRTEARSFSTFEEALDAGRATDPDRDPSMVPTIDPALADDPTYEKGLFWLGNRYAIILRGES